jgi:hypothetical protein
MSVGSHTAYSSPLSPEPQPPPQSVMYILPS